MLTAESQVPVIPLVEVVGSVGAIPFSQIAGIALNVGVTIGFTAMLFVVTIAHCPELGVKT